MLVYQAAADAGHQVVQAGAHPHGFWPSVGHWFKWIGDELVARFGIWGLALIAFLDSALIPITPYGPLKIYISHDPGHYVLYALVAAAAASLGTLVPYYLGRVGGELFLLKKIDRTRYERLRDRFERQEFLAIMLPAICPPPTPLKLFELAAGVFEMRPAIFLLAMFIGKSIQLIAIAAVVRYLGPGALSEFLGTFHRHARTFLTLVGLLTLAVAVWVMRRVFDRRKGTALPIEEAEAVVVKPRIVEQ